MEASSYTGATTVDAGTLSVTGSIATSSLTTVNSGATLTGSGTLGAVTVASGGTVAGTQGQTLTTGDFTLASGAHLAATLGASGGVTPLLAIQGNASLSGALDLTAQSSAFGNGVYRILNYSGALSGSGLTLAALQGSINVPNVGLQTSVPGVINVVAYTTTASFWNGGNGGQGVIEGGNGTWDATTIWTNSAAVNSASIQASAFAIFEGAPGTVDISTSAGPVTIGGMQFVTSDYLLTGGPLTLTNAQTTVRVGDGTTEGAATTATIASALIGAGGLLKSDYGTLVLTGANSYTGGTHVEAGTLALGNGTAAGAGAISLDAGVTLAFTQSLTLPNSIVFTQPGDPTIDTGANSVTLSGVIAGPGDLSKTGSGVLTLTGQNTYTGPTDVVAGTLLVEGSTASSVATVETGAALGGTGTVGGLVALSGGTVAPGAGVPYGTLHVAGDVTFNTGSIYRVQIDAAGQTDAVAATGTATLNGGHSQRPGGFGPLFNHRHLPHPDGRGWRHRPVRHVVDHLEPGLPRPGPAL